MSKTLKFLPVTERLTLVHKGSWSYWKKVSSFRDENSLIRKEAYQIKAWKTSPSPKEDASYFNIADIEIT